MCVCDKGKRATRPGSIEGEPTLNMRLSAGMVVGIGLTSAAQVSSFAFGPLAPTSSAARAAGRVSSNEGKSRCQITLQQPSHNY